jgi:hypothetical protein
MTESKYDYLFARVEYPLERGYRMEPVKLPPWIHVVITEDAGTKYVDVHSRIHVNKIVRLPTSYSGDFSDKKILIDVSWKITSMFL